MKKSILLFILPLLTLMGCKDNNQTLPIKEYVTYTVDFSKDEIKTTDSTSGSFATVMKDNLNLENEIVSSVAGEGFFQINVNCKDHDNNAFKSLIMSSKSSDGIFTLNFVKKLHSLTIHASPYASWIEYTKQWSVDSESTLKINDETWDITPFDTSLTEVPTYQKEFTIEDTSAVIKGTMYKRVIVRQIDFTFEK